MKKELLLKFIFLSILSLGIIFGQYFFRQAREDLVAGLKLYSNKFVYRFFPTQRNRGQSSLIPGEGRKKNIENLVQYSSSSSTIETGRTESKRDFTSSSSSTSLKKRPVFSYQIEKGPFSHIPGQLVSHLFNIKGAPNVKALAISPDGKELWGTLLLNKTRSVVVFSTQNGENLTNLNLQDGGGVEIIFAKDGKRVYVSQMETGKIFEIDAASKKILRVFNSNSTWTKVLAFSKDERTLFASNWVGNNVSEIDLVTGQLKRLIPTVKTPRGIYVTPDGKYLYVAGFARGEIEKIDLSTGKGKVIFKSGGAMRHIVADEKRKILFFSDMGKGIVWKLDLTNDKVEKFAQVDHNPNTILLSPDRKILFVSCRGTNYSPTNYYRLGPEWGSVLLLDARTGKMLDAIIGGNQPTGLAISPDGHRLFFSDFLDQTIEVYQIPDYEVLLKGNGGASKIYKSALMKK